MIDGWWQRWRGMNSSLGEKGERYAARWLKRRGYRIIERNYTVGDDEADVIAIAPDGKTVVIVEVKTRADSDIPPEEQVGPTKRYCLSRLAARLARQHRFADRPFRFDVIAIVWPEDVEKPDVRHYEGAFESRV